MLHSENALEILHALAEEAQDQRSFSAEFLVTTSQDQEPFIQRAQLLAQELGCAFVLRQQRKLRQFFQLFDIQGLVVVEAEQNSLYARNGQKYIYHPNMAKIRALAWTKRQSDSLIRAMDLHAGMWVLDCTFGLGSDALIAGLALGEQGKIVGLESSKLLTVLVQNGLNRYPWLDLKEIGLPLAQVVSRLQLFSLNHQLVLPKLPAKSFDVVYFDPMFQDSVSKAQGINLLRNWGCADPLSLEVIDQARRVARLRVVLKERAQSPEFTRLGFTQVYNSANRIGYGIMEINQHPSIKGIDQAR